MKSPTFRLSPQLELPVEAMTETIAILAQKGFGKTYTAMKLAEQMIKADGQIVALDPVGKWWSLRLARDGKGSWSNIPIFGGLYADFPLPPDKGAFIAELIVSHHTSAVLDVSLMMESEKKRFVADFAARLKHLKSREADSVVHLFLEEAQEFIPQRPQPDEAKMLGALVRIAKLGRNWGIGLTMISQRPQAVNKEALNLASLLLVGCMIAKHDRKAIDDWVEEQGKTDDADAHLAKLPKLQKGQMIAWSPSWLDLLSTVKIDPKETFDASATPRLGSKVGRKFVPTPIDADKIRAAMAETEERAKSEDPAELRKQLSATKHELSKVSHRASKLELELERSRRRRTGPAVQSSQIKQLVRYVHQLGQLGNQLGQFVGQLESQARDQTEAKVDVGFVAGPALSVEEKRRASEFVRSAAKSMSFKAPAPTSDVKLVGRSKLILQHLVARHPNGYTKEQVAILVGMAAGAGGFNNYLGTLRTAGLVVVRDRLLVATEEGIAWLGDDLLTVPATTGADGS